MSENSADCLKPVLPVYPVHFTCLYDLKERVYKLVAMILREDAMTPAALPVDEEPALCFGAADSGLTDVAHWAAGYFARIPISGFTRSDQLPVSVGSGRYQLTGSVMRPGKVRFIWTG